MSNKTTKTGRPPKSDKWLTSKGLNQVKKWAKEGLTDREIAAKMKIATSTFYAWQIEFSEFSDAVEEGKDSYDKEEPVSNLRRIMQGYEKKRTTIDYDPEGNIIKTRVVIEEVPPSFEANRWWLTNRDPEQWKDKQELKLESASEDKHDPFSELTVEELRRIAGLEPGEDWGEGWD